MRITLYCPCTPHGHMKEKNMRWHNLTLIISCLRLCRGEDICVAPGDHASCSRRLLEDGLFCPSLVGGVFIERSSCVCPPTGRLRIYRVIPGKNSEDPKVVGPLRAIQLLYVVGCSFMFFMFSNIAETDINYVLREF